MDSINGKRVSMAWRLLGAFLIALSVAGFMTYLWPQGAVIIFAIAIPIVAMLFFLMRRLDESLRLFWLGDSKQKRQAVYRMIFILFTPLTVFFYLLELGISIALYMAAAMLIWTIPAVKFGLDSKRQNDL